MLVGVVDYAEPDLQLTQNQVRLILVVGVHRKREPVVLAVRGILGEIIETADRR